MEELKSIISLSLIILSINIVYLYVFFKKDYKSYLLIQLEALSKKLGYEIIKDNKTYISKVIEKKIILGSDINLQFDISKLTELYFKIFFNEIIPSTNTINFLKKFTTIIFKVNFYLSIPFSIALFLLVLLNPNDGIAMFFILVILLIGITSLIILLIFYLSFKKTTIQMTDSFGEGKIKLIQTLYWYIPITVFNSTIRFIDYTRWLFSKN